MLQPSHGCGVVVLRLTDEEQRQRVHALAERLQVLVPNAGDEGDVTTDDKILQCSCSGSPRVLSPALVVISVSDDGRAVRGDAERLQNIERRDLGEAEVGEAQQLLGDRGECLIELLGGGRGGPDEARGRV